MISKCERKWLPITVCVSNSRCQHQISSWSHSYPKTVLKTTDKKRRHTVEESYKQFWLWTKISELNKIAKKEVNTSNKMLNIFHRYLWGQLLMSSSEGLRIKSTKALLKVFVGKGGGSSSMAQNRFLANPCWSRVPWLPNCKGRKKFLH